MVEDLKRQASELYKERSETEAIPTSDSLSMKKLSYIFLALIAVVLVVILTFGGFKQHENPVIKGNTPAPLVKEAPPPEVLEPTSRESLSTGRDAPAAAQPARDLSSEAKPLKEKTKSAQRDAQQGPPATEQRRAALPPNPGAVRSERTTPPEVKAPATVVPEISQAENARRALAREIVVEKNPALARLITSSADNEEFKGWKAEPEGPDVYTVSFTFLDKSSGSPVQYVWRVDLNARSTSPLSYYARKLS